MKLHMLIEGIQSNLTSNPEVAYQLLEDNCTRIPASKWREYDFNGLDTAMRVFVALLKSEHCEDAPGSPLHALYLNVTQYLLDNAPPDLRKVIADGVLDQSEMLRTGGIQTSKHMLYS